MKIILNKDTKSMPQECVGMDFVGVSRLLCFCGYVVCEPALYSFIAIDKFL